MVGGDSELFVGEVTPRGFSHEEAIAREDILRGRELWLLTAQVFTGEFVTCEEGKDCEPSYGLLLDGFNHLVPLKTMVRRRNVFIRNN